jgi:D-sedoheptulose 7-phosphate isomerase
METERIQSAILASVDAVRTLLPQAGEIGRIGAAVVSALKAGGKVLTAGNGGSAAEAMHMAEELVGRFRTNRRSLPAVSLAADGTALTCIGNDFGFEAVFSRQIEGLGRAGDVLVLFSTSGRAANLRLALEAARRQGLLTVAFLGRDGGPLRGQADHQIVVPAADTERIQEAHQVLLHLVLDIVERAFTP